MATAGYFSTPVLEDHGVTARRTLTLSQLEGTPVGDQDKNPKIQLCFEIRKVDIANKRALKRSHQLVLEIAVISLKNLPKRSEVKRGPNRTFVKIRLVPGDVIHSTELKMDENNAEMVNMSFMEVFGFPLNNIDTLHGKSVEVLVCDKKMTRNSMIFGMANITDLHEFQIQKPVVKWYSLTNTIEEELDDPEKPSKQSRKKQLAF